MAPGLTSELGTLYRFASPRHRRQLRAIVALMPVTAFAEMVAVAAIVPLIAVLTDVSDTAKTPWLPAFLEMLGATTRDQMLLASGGLFASAAILAAALRLLLSWSSQRFAFAIGHDLAQEIQRRVLHQPYSFHIARHSSVIISSLEKVEQLVFNVLLQLLQASSATILSLFIVAALFAIDARSAATAAIAVAAIYGLVLLLIRKRLAANSAIIGDAYQRRVQAVQESLGAIRDIIIGHSQGVYLDAFRAVDEPLMRARANSAFIATSPRYIIEALGIVVITAMAVFISTEAGGLTAALPALGALVLGAQRLIPLTQSLYHGWTTLAGSRSIITQVVELLDLPLPEDTEAGVTAVPTAFVRDVRFEAVSFAYPGRLQPALDGVDLIIPKGARVALVGRTGSGKSTLADIFMGLLEPTSGKIRIDGVARTAASARGWRRNIAHVPQSIFLADTSIIRNIAQNAPVTAIDMDQVIRAADIAQLGKFIATLPDGYDTIVGEHGVKLSGGQRQRLGLARAIYRRAPILVLDEATSALDDATEAAVMKALDRLGAEGETILIVAHRLSTLATCQMVVRLEEGRIVEVGDFEQAMERPEPLLDALDG